ncbi:MAG: DNA repair protein RecN [Hydrogenovibrio sp.]|uniref:DNA repair protein RecN n=1 Tax=Hydrogenovibrio sp. TaxID=2065821 RepID=UPI00286FAF3E|nr:DNA repair protein RecN [Hydrogenovibrio sp.]MDR9499480.1 DNA repair protein RecN [Hydrogenovibrio sp.]
MLQALTIQNLALISRLHLEFDRGFTTLTGETGAGKSILLDALGLTLGNRADATLVRHGTDKADVTADFDIAAVPAAQAWLNQQELEADGDCLLRRTLSKEGRSKAYINGLPATVAQLKELSALLIDIHGQHQHQSLTQAGEQLALVDAFAQHPPLLADTRETYQAWSKQQQALQRHQENQADLQSRIELLRFQLSEFEKVAPQAEEYAQLSDEQQTLSHAHDIKQALISGYEQLDGEGGASERISAAVNALEAIQNVHAPIEPLLAQLRSVQIDCSEAANDLQHQDHQVTLDPERLAFVDARLGELFALAKKYQIDPESLEARHQQIENELSELTGDGASLEALEAKVAETWQAYQKAADTLSSSRRKAATRLAKSVTERMQSLGMAKGRFGIQLEAAQTPSPQGQDKATFDVTTNPGQPPQPLSKVASGGELSRISLAIQVASAEVASLPTMIFDEVDVGIGGGIAEVVGRTMQQLGGHRQVLAITHLAQVAACAQTQLSIHKAVKNNVTQTQVCPLDQAQRIEELARMLGGMTLTEQTRKHAEEMLSLAQQSA